MMTVTELARRGGVPANVIRYYSRVGLLRPGRNESNRYKLFCSEDLARLRFIRLAQDLGYRLGEISGFFDEIERGEVRVARMLEMLRSHVIENRAKLDELAGLQARMEVACVRWTESGAAAHDLESLCSLVESASGCAQSAPLNAPTVATHRCQREKNGA